MNEETIITTQGSWHIDQNNNKWDTKLFTAEKAAMFSKTLRNCSNCVNCSFLENCQDCQWCDFCSKCKDCDSCFHCRDCANCKHCCFCWACNECFGCNSSWACNNCHECSFSTELSDKTNIHRTSGGNNENKN